MTNRSVLVWLRLPFGDRERVLLLAAVAGLLGAATAALFRYAIYAVLNLYAVVHLVAHATRSLVELASAMPTWERVLFPTVGGLVAGGILMLGSRLPSTTDYMEAIVIGDGRMDVRTTLTKSLSSLVSIVSGGSIGREGSMVQLGALSSSLLARMVALPVTSRPLIVACGAAAGIASVYDAPLAGALFVAEVVMGTMAVEVLGPLMVAAVIASATSRYLFHAEPLYMSHAPALSSLWQLPLYGLFGIAAGILAPLYLGALDGMRRLFSGLGGAVCWKLMIGGAMVGIISAIEPMVWGNGNHVISSLLSSSWLLGALGVLIIAKIAATAATTGSGAVGGVFTPTLAIGAAFGAALSVLAHHVAPGLAPDPAAGALVGMGAFLAATTQAPVMAMLMVFEMSLDSDLILPLMLSCIAAHYLVQVVGCPALYNMGGKHRERTATLPAWSRLSVRDLVQPTGLTVRRSASFADIAKAFRRHSFNFIFVVDEDGTYRGALSMHDLKEHLSDDALDQVAVAQDLLIEIPVLRGGDDLNRAIEAFGRFPGNRVPVLDEGGRIIGCVHKYDLMVAFARGPGSQDSRAEPSDPVAAR